MGIKVGEYDVLESGAVGSVDNKDVIFEIAPNIKLRLSFDDDVKSSGSSVRINSVNESELRLILVNFNNPLGTEIINPIEVGRYKGRPLLFHVKVLGMENNKNRTILYTWYLGEEVANG